MRAAALVLISAIALAACNSRAGTRDDDGVEGPGTQIKRSYEFANFNSVSLAGSHNVIVTVGPAFSVRAEGDSNVIERLEIKVEGGELKIGSKHGRWSMRRHNDSGPVTIYVTAPALAAASIGGSGDIKVDKVEGAKFAGSIGGSGDLEIAAMNVEDATFAIAGSGAIRATGRAGSSTMSIAGSGDMDLSALEARTAKVSVVGSGDVRARATETADVSIMGSGDVSMAGSAKCTINKMGSGDVRCEA